MGADADACRAVIVNRIRDALIPLRELHDRVVKEVDEPALLEELQRASILEEPAARRVARCLAEVRLTYHRAWRDLVKDLESGDQEGQSGSDPDDEKEGNDQDQDQIRIRMGRRERRPRRPRRRSFARSRSTLPRGRTRYPRRVVAKRVNFYHSNPRKLLNSRRNFLKLSWFPSSFRPLGFRAQKALRLGARGVQTGCRTRARGVPLCTRIPPGKSSLPGHGRRSRP